MVHNSKSVTGRCIGDGMEGCSLRLRGPKHDRADQEAGCLDPADCDDGVSDEALTVVHVKNKRHVLIAITEQSPCSAGGARRIVNPNSIPWNDVRVSSKPISVSDVSRIVQRRADVVGLSSMSASSIRQH